MPRCGDVDMEYPNKLRDIGIELLEPFVGSKIHHQMKCMVCDHKWTATPISKLQNFKKWGAGGCPRCTTVNRLDVYSTSRRNNTIGLDTRGLEIVSDWDGRNSTGAECKPLPVTVRNKKCGHTFTSTAVNLLRRDVTCPICAKQYKTNIINASSERRSNAWKQTATAWQKYKSIVVKLTRVSYTQNKEQINPNDYPQGRAGVEGAYHIDHIVPIWYCFDHNIPVEICAHPTNLQMLGWRDNVGSRDKLKNGVVPVIFETLMAIQ